MQGFIVKNPNGSVIAFFKDSGLAKMFCHVASYPESWIHNAIIELKIGADSGSKEKSS